MDAKRHAQRTENPWRGKCRMGDVALSTAAADNRSARRARVVALLMEGRSYSAIARELGCAKATVAYHARRFRAGHGPGMPDAANRYDWDAVRAFYEAGHAFVECREKFGFSGGSWSNAIERGDIIPREKELDSYASRRAFKRRLTRDGMLTACCAECGISEWRGKRIVLELHHVNGQKDDHRPENVVLLCPNCHSQTDTYRTKNRARSGVA